MSNVNEQAPNLCFWLANAGLTLAIISFPYFRLMLRSIFIHKGDKSEIKQEFIKNPHKCSRDFLYYTLGLLLIAISFQICLYQSGVHGCIDELTPYLGTIPACAENTVMS